MRVVVLGLVLASPFVPATALAEEEPLPPPPIVISAPRAEVWAGLTTVEGILATEGGQATVDLRPGGAIRRHPDAKADALAPGWTSTPVLALVAPRILILGDEAPATWTSIELDALDPLRTRVRIEHVGVAAGSKIAAAAEEHDAAFVARLEKRFPPKPDPVVAAWTSLVGTWEERSEAGREVLARWTIAFDTGVGLSAAIRSAISLERRSQDDASVERWVFWRESESGRWIGGLVAGGRLAAWAVIPYASGGIEWSNRWGDLGSRTLSIEIPPHDGVAEMEIIDGCTGRAFRWTRAAEPKERSARLAPQPRAPSASPRGRRRRRMDSRAAGHSFPGGPTRFPVCRIACAEALPWRSSIACSLRSRGPSDDSGSSSASRCS